MAANFGKFIDRSPEIYAAGKSSGKERDIHQRDDSVGVGEVVKENPLEADNPKLITEEIQPIMSPIVKESKIQSAQETSSKDYVQSQDEDSVTALMHPTRTPYQVMWDSQIGHEEYRTTHDDYNAPKDYNTPKKSVAPVALEKCLKAAGKYNSKGIWVRCVCDWHKRADDRSAEIEADYVDRYKSQIGKSLNPNHNIDSVPKGFAFGMPSEHESSDMEEVKDADCPPCEFRRDFYKSMAALNKCRNALKERDFNFKEFYATLLDHDNENTGFLPVDEVYDICFQEHITFDKDEIEALLKVLKIIVDDKIDYGRFIEIIDVNKSTIDVVPFHGTMMF